MLYCGAPSGCLPSRSRLSRQRIQTKHCKGLRHRRLHWRTCTLEDEPETRENLSERCRRRRSRRSKSGRPRHASSATTGHRTLSPPTATITAVLLSFSLSFASTCARATTDIAATTIISIDVAPPLCSLKSLFSAISLGSGPSGILSSGTLATKRSNLSGAGLWIPSDFGKKTRNKLSRNFSVFILVERYGSAKRRSRGGEGRCPRGAALTSGLECYHIQICGTYNETP